MKAENFTKIDFDVWFELSELANQLHTRVYAQCISVYTVIDPIHLEGKFNIMMDHQAERRREASVVTLHSNILFKTEKATLRVNDTIITIQTAKYITNAMTAPPMCKYILEKRDGLENHMPKWIRLLFEHT